MAAFILLGLLSSAEQTYSKNDGIDAGAITWQINKWSPRPIEASTPNARQTGVTMEFRFRITTALAISNVIEIYFPAEFAHPTKSL